MRPIFVAICGMVLVLAACSPPVSSEPGPGTASSAAPSTRPTSAATSGPASGPLASASSGPDAADPLLALELVDARSGARFTLGELAADKPVLVEAMAIWCSTCRAQQREVIEAHQLADFHSVGIDVDPNERAEDLAEYADREGFDWRFAMADAQLVQLLTDRFGFAVTNPPSTPTLIVSADRGVRALEFGRVRSADELVAELTAG
jgi:thiol-disulfide isomerase/thioredoxin